MKILFCWAEASGYMAACWRALADRPGVSVHVLHPKHLDAQQPNLFETEPLLRGIPNEVFDAGRPGADAWLQETIARIEPDVIVVCGWFFPIYRRMMLAPALRRFRCVLGMDSPWTGKLRQRLAKFRVAPLVRRTSLVITAGDRSSEYARRVGFRPEQVRTGYYGFDHESFRKAGEARPGTADRWPRQFLFTGRYVPAKDLPSLAAAYRLYRSQITEPWGLTCCGAGSEAAAITGVPGLTDTGFVQPAELPALFAKHGAFVLASRYEPWGVVIGEAAASGLPILCTNACGAGLDMVRPYYNGLITTPGDVAGLARSLRWLHEHAEELPAMGERSRELSRAYSAQAWAARWHNYFLEALEMPVAG